MVRFQHLGLVVLLAGDPSHSSKKKGLHHLSLSAAFGLPGCEFVPRRFNGRCISPHERMRVDAARVSSMVGSDVFALIILPPKRQIGSQEDNRFGVFGCRIRESNIRVKGVTFWF